MMCGNHRLREDSKALLTFDRVYVQTTVDEDQIGISAEVTRLKELLTQRDQAEAKMLKFLQELGYDRPTSQVSQEV